MDVRMPDGTVIKNVPDDVTQEDLQEMYGDHQKMKTPGQIASAELERMQSADEQKGIGMGRGFTDFGEGVKQLALDAGESFGLVPPGRSKEYTAQAEEERQFYEQTPAGQSMSGKVGRFAGNVAPYAAMPAGAATLAGRIGLGSATGAVAGGTQFVPEGGSRAQNTLIGAALGGAIPIATQGITAMWQPMTQGGREGIVGNALRRLSTNPDDASARLNSRLFTSEADELVPGSVPTTAQATSDPGLLSLERAVRSTPAGSRFAIRDAQQNAARTTLLNSVAKDKQALEAAIAQRETEAIPLINAARNSGAKVDIGPINQKIDDLLSGEAGKRTVVRKALVDVKRNLFSKVGENKVPETDVGRIYGIRKDITDAMQGKLGGDKSSARFARKELLEVMESLDDQINKVAPEFKPYLQKYSELSSPVKQMETLQGIAQDTKNAAIDVTGENVISQGKWFNLVTKNKEDLAKTLTPEQMGVMERIGKDLDRGSLSVTGGKAAGSNTFQNLSTANVLGEVLGKGAAESPALQTALRPLKWVYQIPEQRMQEMLVDAMLDPTAAKLMMQKATQQNVSRLSARLRQLATVSGTQAATK